MKTKIVISGVMNDTNTGDEVIADSFNYLIGGQNENNCRGTYDGYQSGGRGVSYLSRTPVFRGGGAKLK